MPSSRCPSCRSIITTSNHLKVFRMAANREKKDTITVCNTCSDLLIFDERHFVVGLLDAEEAAKKRSELAIEAMKKFGRK